MTIAQTLAVTGAVSLSSTVQATEFRVGGNKVVGARQASIAYATSSNKLNRINDIIDTLRTHGLIA